MLQLQALRVSTRKLMYGFAAGLVVLAATIMMPLSAHASTVSGTRQLYVANGFGILQWNASNDSLFLYSDPGFLPGGQCGDAIFDWDRTDYNPLTSDHHDARIVRVCQSYGTHSANIGTDTGGSLQGMQKAAFCVGSDNATTNGPCSNAGDAVQIVQGNVNVSIPNNCVRAWKKHADGSTSYYSGGASTSCTS